MPPPELINDPSISDDEILWRRISPDETKPDPSGAKKPSTAAFTTFQMSVNIASLTTQDRVLENYPTHNLVGFTAGFVRSIGCIVVRDPILPGDPKLPEDPSHALVCHNDPGKRITHSQAKKFKNIATWIVLRE